jgi:hypothetical protein
MKKLLLLLLALPAFGQVLPELQIYTKDDWDLSSQSNAWSRSETFLTYGSWLARRDSVATQITATLSGPTGSPGTYRVFLKAYTRNFANASSLGTAELRLGTNAWANIDFGQLAAFVGTNYVAADAFTNAQVRFNWIATGNVQDFYLEAFALASNTNVAAPGTSDPEPAASLAYIDAFYDYSVPAVQTDTRPGNLLRNSSFELGYQPGWMYARISQVDSNTAKPTYLVDAVGTTNGAVTGNTLGWITDARARFALYNGPTRLRPGTRQYTLSFYLKGLASSLTARFTSLAFTNRYVATSQTNVGYSWNWSAPGTTNWVRYSTNFWAADQPTPEWKLTLESGTLTSIYVDDIQLEEGGTATAWAPKHGVEFVLRSPKKGAIYFDAEPITLDLVTYNYGAGTSNFTWSYVAYGQTNHQFGVPIFSGEFNGSVGSGKVTNTITVPPWLPFGHYRIVSRSASHPEIDETMFSKVWASDNTNGFIGIHSQTAADSVATNFALGFPVVRTLSPGGYARWSVIEASDNVFAWDATDWKIGSQSGQQIFLSLYNNAAFPAWAVTSGNMVDTNHLWDYVNRVAGRYTNKVAYYEARNEPSSSLTSTNLRDLCIAEETAIHAAYPAGRYVACGGMADTTIASNFLSILPASTLSNIYALSCHLYPAGGNVVMDMNVDDTDRTRYEAWKALGAAFGKPIINSESGVYDNGPTRTYNLGIQSGAKWTYESLRHEPIERAGYQSTMRAIAILARSLGHGFIGCHYYDARFSSYDRGSYIDTNPTVWDFYDEARPQLAAILQFKRLIDPPTFAASVTNITKTDAYVFGKSGLTVAILWTQDKTNRSVNLGTTNFGVHDIFGNLLQTNEATVQIGRVAKYLVSSLVSTTAMVSLISTSSVSVASDTNPPTITMDWAPVASLNAGGSNNVLIKWTTLDDTVMNTPLYRSNVLNRYRAGPSAAWGDWSESTVARFSNLSNGMFRFDVQAKDKYNNTSQLAGMTFAVSNGVAVIPLTVMGTANVSTLTVP